MKKAVCVVLLLSVALFCMGCADSTEDSTYTATAKIRLALPQTDADDLIRIYLVDNAESLVKFDSVLLSVIENEALSCSVEELSSLIRVQRDSEEKSAYYISVIAKSGEDAVRIANAVATAFCERVNNVYGPDGMKEPVAKVLEKATAPNTKDET